jgi:hypothetical protein
VALDTGAFDVGEPVMSRDKSGPAFPVHPDMPIQMGCVPSKTDSGMSLRDYIAVAAMQGGIAGTGPDAEFSPVKGSRWAYEIADAMLEARK